VPGVFPDSGVHADQIVLTLPDSGQTITRFREYLFDSDFLEPADAWSFSIGGTGVTLDPALVESLYAGARVTFSIDGKTQGGGRIDVVDGHHGAKSGSIITVHGRDAFGPVVDDGADPTLYTFQPGMTLEQAVRLIFKDFGFTRDDQFQISNDANRSVMTGVRTTTKAGKALKARAIAKQLKPYPAEGLFAYLTRFLHRFGLWCWPSADQSTVIVDVPHFDLPPAYSLVRKADGTLSNVKDGGVKEDSTNQPSVIVATGVSGGDPSGRSRYKVIAFNELTCSVTTTQVGGTTTIGASTELVPRLQALVARHQDARVLPQRPVFSAYLGTLAREDPNGRALFLHDEEAKSLDALEKFVLKELSLRQRRMWSGSYLVEGHTQGGVPYAVDTISNVDDDFPPGRGFHGQMWLRGRTFAKSVKGGAGTALRLILPHTLDFGSESADDG
jgi:prophage tail gpP-like protein